MRTETEKVRHHFRSVSYFVKPVPTGIKLFLLPIFPFNLPRLTKSEASLSVDKYTYKADPLIAFKFSNLRKVLPSSRSTALATPSTL